MPALISSRINSPALQLLLKMSIVVLTMTSTLVPCVGKDERYQVKIDLYLLPFPTRRMVPTEAKTTKKLVFGTSFPKLLVMRNGTEGNQKGVGAGHDEIAGSRSPTPRAI